MTSARARRAGLDLATQQLIRADLDAALLPIARKHSVSVPTLLRLAALGGSAQA